MAGLRGIPTTSEEANHDLAGTAFPADLSLPDVVPPAAGAPSFGSTPSEVSTSTGGDDALKLPDEPSSLENVYRDVSRTEPVRASRVVGLAEKLKEPEAFVDKNLDALEKTANAPAGSYFKELETQYPGTSKWLSDPRNMAVSSDDLQNLSSHEEALKEYSTARTLWHGLNSGIASMFANAARIPALGVDAAALPYNLGVKASGGDESLQIRSPEWLRNNPVTKYFEDQAKGYQVPEMETSIVERIGKGDIGGASKALAVQFLANAPTQAAIIAGTLAGYGVPTLVGMGVLTAADVNKRSQESGVDPAAATSNALLHGTVESAFESLGTFGILKHWEGAISRSFGKSTSRQLMTDFAKTLFYSALGEGNEEALTSLAQDFSDVITGVNPKAMQGSLARAANAGIVGAASGVALTGPSAFGAGVVRARAEAKQVEAAQNFYLALGASAEASKLRERLPEAHRAYIEEITKDGPVENVFVPVEDFDTYFQSKSGDPNQVAADLGVTDSYTEAKASGGDVQIPLATFAAKLVGTEHYQGLKDDVKFHPEDLTFRQLGIRQEEAKAATRAVEEQASKAAEPPPSTLGESAAKIHDDIAAQLKAAGVSAAEVKADPQLYEAFFRTLGERMGIDPYELYRQYGVKVQSAETTAAQEQERSFEQEGNAGFAKDGETEQASVPLPEKVAVTSAAQHQTLKSADKGEAKREAQALAAKGPFVNRHTGETIHFSGQGVRKAVSQAIQKIGIKRTAGREHLEALQYMRGLVENAVFVSEKADTKDRANEWLYFFAPLEMNGKRYSVKLEVKREKQGLYLHNFAVVPTDRGVPKSTIRTGAPEANVNSIPAGEMGIADFTTQIKSARERHTFFQSQTPPAPPFYSKLTRTIEEKMGGSATVEQVNALLRETKEEERKWSGIDEFLKGKEKVSKAELLDFLRGNQLEVKEVEKVQNDPSQLESLRDQASDELAKLVRRYPTVEDRTPEIHAKILALNAERNRLVRQVSKADETKFSQYKLPGGENYREVLFTLPERTKGDAPGYKVEKHPDFDTWNIIWDAGGREGGYASEDLARYHAERQAKEFQGASADNYTSGHWDEANVLAHVRLDDRVDADGKRVLFVEEIQSDLHQEGRKKGYKGDVEEDHSKPPKGWVFERNPDGTVNAFRDGIHLLKDFPEADALKEAWVRTEKRATGGVPDAPFRKTWHEFALKRILRMAAEGGYDRVAWTTGEQQAERYDLSKEVSKLQLMDLTPANGEGFDLIGLDEDGETVFSERISDPAEMEKFVGKDIAAKMAKKRFRENDYGMPVKSLSGVDLKLGGEGMKGFYDKILVDAANKLGKKFGAKVGETGIESGPKHGLGEWMTMRTESGRWQVLRRQHDRAPLDKTFADKADAEAKVEELNSAIDHGVKVHSLDITPALRDSALNEGFSLFQGGDEGARGRIRFGERGVNIDLLKGANKSTFLHETGHLFLEVFADSATAENAPDAVKADYATLLAWLGVKSREEIGTEQHEKFARGFEAYLREGRAPSTGLQRAFASFKKWLTSLYKSLRQLNVELTPEVRGVLDRLLATEEEIAKAQDSLGLATDIEGLTPEVAARIGQLQAEAREAAEGVLVRQQMADMRLRTASFIEEQRQKLTALAEAEVAEIPLYAASDAVRAGRRLTAAELARRLSNGTLKDEDATRFEIAAEEYGFGSGEELAMKILDDAEKKGREGEIQSRVDAGLKQYDGLSNPETLRAAAIKAVHTEKMTELLALEKEALQALVDNATLKDELSRRNRIEARVDADAAKAEAKAILAKKPIKGSGPAPYVTAERNAAARVAKALAKKDYAAAAKAKREQMLSHALAAEAMRNVEKTQKVIEDLSELGARGRDLLSAPYGFIVQIDALMARFGFAEERKQDVATFAKIAQTMQDAGEEAGDIANATGLRFDETSAQWVPESLNEFVARVNESYYGLTIPDSVRNSGQRAYREMTLAELGELKQATDDILFIGKRFNRFLTAFDKADVKEAARAFRASVEENVGAPYADSLKVGSKHKGALGEKVDRLLKLPDFVVPDLVNILTLCHYLDGGKEDGPAKEYIYRPLKRAEDRKLQRYEQMTKDVNALLEKAFTPKELAAYKDRREYVESLGRYMTREERLLVAMNWGNEGNRDRIRRGFGLEESQINEILDVLDKKEWDFVQSVWDYLDTFWPDIVALETQVRGVEPARVQPVAVSTRHGSYRGGYFPIAYDFERSSDALRFAEEKNALFKQYSSAAAHTDTGHTKERVATVKRPVRLAFDVFFNHLENVVHDLEYRAAVIDVHRFLQQRDTKSALENSIGVRGFKAIADWLKAVASDQGEHLNMADKALRWFRFNATFATLSYRAFTFPMDWTGNVINGIWEIGPKRLAAAIAEYMAPASRRAMKEFVDSKSERMKRRATLRDRDIADIAKKWKGKESALQTYAFFFQLMADESVSYPLWNEVYKQALEANGEQKAKDIADEAVTRTVGSGSSLDQVGAQRGGEGSKILSMYYSWASMMFNRAWLAGKMAGLEYDKGNTMAAIAIVAEATFVAWGLHAVNETFWRELVRNGQGDDDEERKKRILARVLQQPFGYVWLVRDIAGFVVDKAVGKHSASYRLSPVESAIESILTPFGEAASVSFSDTKHFDQKSAEHAARSASYLLGYPQQLNALGFNFLDWMQGEGEASWRDLLQRRTKK